MQTLRLPKQSTSSKDVKEVVSPLLQLYGNPRVLLSALQLVSKAAQFMITTGLRHC
jgi:hypothetical protein